MSDQQPKLVIIEDEPLLLKALNIELLDGGFQIYSALDGERGLELIYKEKPDLVLLDMVLPKISGFEVLARIKKDPLLKNIPVIALSNRDQKQEQEQAFELGADDYFIKSNTDLTQLTNKLKSCLSKKTTNAKI